MTDYFVNLAMEMIFSICICVLAAKNAFKQRVIKIEITTDACKIM